MKVVVVGTGYVGLVTGTCFAEVGIDTTCVDIDVAKIENLKKGILPIYEPGLDTMIHRNVEKNRLHFTTDLASTLPDAEVVFIAVGTPPDEDGSADLKHVLAVASEVGRNMEDYLLVVTKSTVPVGTAVKVKNAITKELTARGVKIDFDVALIGCGAYGFPLAAKLKQAGKVTILMGGVTQMLFGIKGSRWDTHPVASKLYNEHWVRPKPKERPVNADTVEGACYW